MESLCQRDRFLAESRPAALSQSCRRRSAPRGPCLGGVPRFLRCALGLLGGVQPSAQPVGANLGPMRLTLTVIP
jgi:hypothetical protein